MTNQMTMFFNRRNYLAWLVLLICLLLLALAQRSLLLQTQQHATHAFDNKAGEILNAINTRLQQHEHILLASVGLFKASTSVERSEWHAFVESLQLEHTYPGIQGVGFARMIQPRDLPAHIASIRAEGFPQYDVRPAGVRPLYTSIIYLEPFSGRNLAAFGFDMLSEPVRAKAMRRAVDENQTSMTGKVTLVQENQGAVQAGFLMYLPVYSKQMPLTTPAQRWAALDGYVYSPYRMNDLMQGILGSNQPPLDFTLFDGEQLNDDAQMYASADVAPLKPANFLPLHTTQLKLEAYGHTWTVQFQSRPEFEAAYPLTLDIPMLLMGSLSSCMVFVLISMLTIRSSRAEAQRQLLEQQVNERTNNLREAMQLQVAVLENAGHAIIATTPEGVITVFNKTAELLLGYNAAEMIGKQTPAVFHDSQEVIARAHTFSTELNTTIEPGFEVFVAKSRRNLSNEHEWTYINKNGKHFPVSLSITALRNSQNDITGFLGVAVDITTQKINERTLIDNANHTQAILDNVVDGIITINKNGIVQSFNRSAENIFGYSAADIIGNNIKMLMPEPYHSQHDGYLENFNTTGVARIIGIGREVTGQRKDGSTFPMDLAVSHSSHQGQPLFIGLVRDITERKRIEKMKSEFVSTVSHELRTPLTSISGALGLITGGVLGELPAQQKQMIDLAHKNALRLTDLINDLLDMEKLVAGKMHFEMMPQALLPLLEQTLQSVDAYAEQHHVRCRLMTDNNADLRNIWVRVDAMRLQQVLTNFLSNAAKFSPQNEQVEVAIQLHDNKVRVEVIDHGPGIPAEFRKRIFQKFSQADSSDTRQKGGTGLGLAISKELIERMGGTVGFVSDDNKGTCFYFELPRAIAPAAQLTTQQNIFPGAAHLLVVEDDAAIGRLFTILLNDAGYNVDVATNVETALNYLSQHQYNAITLDLMLPDQSGISLIRQLRNQKHTETLPIIVISAYSQDGKLAINGDFQAIDWLEKPVSASQLTSTLQRTLAAQTSSNKPRVLHVEDDADIQQVITTLARDLADFDVAPTLADAFKKLKHTPYNLVVIDIGLPDGSGWDLLPALQLLDPKPPVIVLSGKETSEEQKKTVQKTLLKSRASNDVILDTLKQVLAGNSANKSGAMP